MTLLYFHSTDCAPCKSVERDLKTISNKIPLDIQKVDIHQNYALVEKYNVMKLPTLVILSGVEVVSTFVGYSGFDALATFIEDNYVI